MSKKCVAASVRVSVMELDEVKRVELQQVFLDQFLKVQKFATACRWLKNNGLPEGTTDEVAEAIVGQWVEECPEFKAAFDKARRIIGRIGAVKAEEFLTDYGTGKIKTGKVSGMGQANAVASHMVLEADDKARWSSKVEVKKTESRTITTIIKHYGANGEHTEIVDAPEVKELPVGRDGDSDEE